MGGTAHGRDGGTAHGRPRRATPHWLRGQAAFCGEMVSNETAFRPWPLLRSPPKLNPRRLTCMSGGSGGPELLGRIVLVRQLTP